MSISDEDKERILAEERARIEAREQAEKEAKKKKGSVVGKLFGGCLFVFIGIPVGLAFLGGVMKGVSGEKDAGSGKSAATSQAAAPAEEENIVSVKLGARTVKAALVDETLHIVEKLERRKKLGNEFVNETADGEFLIVRMIVRNDSKETRTIGASQMSILDTAGREFRTSSEGGTALAMSGDKTAEFLLTEVQPGLEKRVTIVFDVPPGSKDLKLKVPSGGFGSPAVLSL